MTIVAFNIHWLLKTGDIECLVTLLLDQTIPKVLLWYFAVKVIQFPLKLSLLCGFNNYFHSEESL